MYSFLLTPLSAILIVRGIYIIMKRKSAKASYFISASLLLSTIVALFYLFSGKSVFDSFADFTLPFGLVGWFVLDFFPESSVLASSVTFVFGVFLNSCSIGSLIEFAEHFNRRMSKL
jgi:hypothetical protein